MRITPQYSAEQPADFLHMRLEMTFTEKGMKSRRCEGQVTWTLQPRVEFLPEIRLDAVGMTIFGVKDGSDGKALEYSYDDAELVIRPAWAIPRHKQSSISVRYEVNAPDKGLHFVLPSAWWAKRPLMVYTFSEPLQARYWVPCHDWPNERWTSEFLLTVPKPYMAVANGQLIGQEDVDEGKARRFHWKFDTPTDPHLLGFVVGELVPVEGSEWQGKPLQVYTQPGLEEAARNTLWWVPSMMAYFSQLMDVPLPYENYRHVTVVDHHHGGMEHAGFSEVSSEYLAAEEAPQWPQDLTEKWLIAHMLAHQWFGGMVNYRSVAEAWLNEGFATYLDTMWAAKRDGIIDRLGYEMRQKARVIIAANTRDAGHPMVERRLAEMEDIYNMDGGKVYQKGAWVIHMLRMELGDEVFWNGVRGYLESHKGGSAGTSDLRRAFEASSGRDLEQFFDQWVYEGGVPHLKVEYAWEGAARQARITVTQEQTVDAVHAPFVLPLEFKFRVSRNWQDIRVVLRETRQEFRYRFDREPDLFCVDPEAKVLMKADVTVPWAMRLKQAEEGPFLARIEALGWLSEDDRPDALVAFKNTLWFPQVFWGVHVEAARLLGGMGTAAALEILLEAEAKHVWDERELSAVVEALGQYPRSKAAHERLLVHARKSDPLRVSRAALRALGGMRSSPELSVATREALVEAARPEGRRFLRLAALQALEELDDPEAFEAIWDWATAKDGDPLLANALEVLGKLGRGDERRDRTLEFLRRWLDEEYSEVREAAIAGLGQLGDARALPELRRLRGNTKSESLREVCDGAIAMIRNPEDGSRRAKSLATEVEQLREQAEMLEKRLETLDRPAETGSGKRGKVKSGSAKRE